jgi:hypothetical protein
LIIMVAMVAPQAQFHSVDLVVAVAVDQLLD